MKLMTGLSAVLLAGVLGATSVVAQETETTKLTELERISDAIGLQELIVEKIRENFLSNPEVLASGLPEEKLMKMRDILIERFDMQDFLSEALLPVLDPHFTADEFRSIADLLESTLGQNFVAAQKSGVEFDFMTAMQSGEIDREEAMKAMTVFMTLGPKLQELQGGTLKADIETSVKSYAQEFFVEVVGSLIDNAAE